MKGAICGVVVLLLLLTSCSSRLRSEGSPGSSSLEVSQEQQGSSPFVESSVAETSGVAGSDATSAPVTLDLVVPEGYTLPRIGMTLESMGICTVEEFIVATQTGNFSDFPLVAQQKESPNRCYKLEGYLFPDTYEIYSSDTADTVIRRMLANTERRFSAEVRQQIAGSGYTVDEILALASIVEKEAFERNETPVPQEMPKVSAVLHNRLEAGMPLQCDVTITYVTGAIAPFVPGGEETYKWHYNTYRTPALPAGAICNPGMDAILAAVAPADTKDLFFLTDEDKNFYYSETFEEHEVLVEKYLGK